MLVFPDVEACRKLCAGIPNGASVAEILNNVAVREAFRERLVSFAASATGSSNCIARAIVLEEPPSLDGGEMTDKGSLNQRAVLDRRAALVDELYSGESTDRVICLTRK